MVLQTKLLKSVIKFIDQRNEVNNTLSGLQDAHPTLNTLRVIKLATYKGD